MEIYFLKSTASLALLMLFYKLFLEMENMHVFKRFYLLGAVAASCLIPLITFTTYVEPGSADSNLVSSQTIREASATIDIYLVDLLWMFYALGVLFFGLKFFLNLKALLVKIRRNPQEREGNTINVLLDEKVAPHTFLNYIFVNKNKYRKHRIPTEVLEHERAHARQRHSFDILFMESLQVLFWFNPLLYFVKQSIKLNHEFLADRAVLQNGTKTSAYQQTLLAFSSGASNCSFVNSINYSLIKKRFTIMKTHTTKKAIWLRSLMLLPLFALLIYSCSDTEELQMPIEENSLNKNPQEFATSISENYQISTFDGHVIEMVVDIESESATPEMIAEFNEQTKEAIRNWTAEELRPSKK